MSIEKDNYFDFFNEVFAHSGSSILYHKSGLCVHLMFERITEIGCFPNACSEVLKYFPLKDGEAVLLNDPYTGGGSLNNFSLIMGTRLTDKKEDEASYLIGIRFSIRPKLSMGKSIDDEGLKIPPTPILDNRKKIDSIVEAICAHPSADPSFQWHLESAIEKLLTLDQKLKDAKDIWGISFEQKSIEKYIDFCHTKMKDFLTKIKNKKVFYKEQWITGESLAANLEKTPDKLIVEFLESESSEFYHLTSAASFGACFSALLNALGTDIPLNSGSLDCLEVKTPNKSFLNAQQNSPVFLGFNEGAGLVANFFTKLLSKVSKNLQSAEGNIGVCSLDIEFDSGKHFYDRLASGLGGQSNGNGSSAVDKWTHTNLQASIEDIELRFPIRIRSTSYRLGSGGNGTHTGGDGIVRSYLFLGPAKIKWFSAMTGHSADGYKGASSGLSPQFLLTRNNQRSRLNLHGEHEILSGDRLDILSAGGGGYGDGYEDN